MNHSTGIIISMCLLLAEISFNPASARSLAWQQKDSDALRTKVESGTYGTVTSVLIMHQGRAVFEQYFNGANAETLHDTRSVTKTITGMAIGRLVDLKQLSLNSKAAKYFVNELPFANPDSRKSNIEIEDLLTMSSPLECNDWNNFSRGNEERMYLVEDWSSFFWDLPIRGFPSWEVKPEDSPYGRSFSYCTAGVQLLGEIVQRVSGEKFTEFVKTEFFAPLRIEEFEWPLNGIGQVHMGGGLKLTSRALARFGELQRNHGVYQGKRLLTQQWTKAAIAPRVSIPGDRQQEYGYLWWLEPYSLNGKTYYAAAMNGNGGNRVMVMPEFGLTVVLTKTDYNSRGMHSKTDLLFQEHIFSRLAPE